MDDEGEAAANNDDGDENAEAPDYNDEQMEDADPNNEESIDGLTQVLTVARQHDPGEEVLRSTQAIHPGQEESVDLRCMQTQRPLGR